MNAVSSVWSLGGAVILGLLFAGVTAAGLLGWKLPLIETPKASAIALLVIGMTLCAVNGIGHVSAAGRWASPVAILGYLLGVAILVVFVSLAAGWRLPWTATPKTGLVWMAALTALKVVVGTLAQWLRWY